MPHFHQDTQALLNVSEAAANQHAGSTRRFALQAALGGEYK